MDHKANRNFYTNGQADSFYDDAGFLIESEARIMRSLLEQIPNIKTSNILDAGCGAGIHLQNIRKITTGTVYGIDSSEEMLEKAKKVQSKTPPVKFAQVDLVEDDICSTIMEPKGFFDIAICTWVVCHARNEGELQKIIGNVARSLKTGAKFYIITVNPGVSTKDFEKFVSKYSFTFVIPDKTKDELSSGDEYIFTMLNPKTKEKMLQVPSFYYDRETFERVLKEEGFEVNRIVNLGEITGVPPELVDKDRTDGGLIEATKL